MFKMEFKKKKEFCIGLVAITDGCLLTFFFFQKYTDLTHLERNSHVFYKFKEAHGYLCAQEVVDAGCNLTGIVA